MEARKLAAQEHMKDLMKRMKEVDVRSGRPANVGLLDFRAREIYHVTKFWCNIGVDPWNIVSGEIVHKAFKDLCRLLTFSTKPSTQLLNLACILSTQLRSPEDHQSLLIDQEKFRATFQAGDSDPIENFFITADDEEDFGEPHANFVDFLASVDAMDEEEAIIFGPIFACVVATLKKCSARTAANKIFFMKSNFEKFYPRTKITVRLPPKELLIDVFHKHKEAVYAECRKRTLLLGCMFAYYKQDLTAQTKEMLDTLVLKSSRYASMQLLTLVDEVTKTYGCSVDEYRRLTDCNVGNRSWSAYENFMAEYGPERKPVEGEQPDSFWMYAREFNHRVFQELTYKNNVWLCNFSADLVDLKLHSDRVKAWPVLGPTYQNLTKFRQSKGLCYFKEHHEWALVIHNKLNALRH